MSKTTILNSFVFPYILNAIDGEGYGKELNTDQEKLQFLADTFKKEYVFPENLKRYGSYQEVFRQWIMGLPTCFSIDYSYYDTIQLAKKWGTLPENATEKQEDRIKDNWFNLIANKTFILMKKYKVLPH
jgi:hypothetical protein